MSKAAAKAPWEIAIEKMAATFTAGIAEARAEAKEARAEAKEAAAEAKERAKEADKRAEERAAEADKRAKEAEARAEERAKEADKRAKEAAAEAKERAKEEAIRAKKAAEETAELRRIMNAHSTEEGETLEQNVAATIVDAMSLDGVKFDFVVTNSHVHGKHGDGEFDWIGINGKVIFVGETRLTLNRGDVRRFATDRIALFKRASPYYIKGRAVQGALIYQKARAGAIEEALRLKMKVFRAGDDKTLRPVKTPADIPKRNQTKTHNRRQSAG